MTTHPKLTAVLHVLVKKAPSGLDAETVAPLLGYTRYSTMMSELSDQPGHKLGANMLLPIMELTGSDEPLHFLARQRGGVFIKLPQMLAGDDPLQGAAMKSIKETGEFLTALGSSLADGDLSKDDCERIEKEAHEAATATMALIKMVADIRRGQS